jgi:hypothetical protein
MPVRCRALFQGEQIHMADRRREQGLRLRMPEGRRTRIVGHGQKGKNESLLGVKK